MLSTTATAIRAICAADPTLDASRVECALRVLDGVDTGKPDKGLKIDDVVTRLGVTRQTVHNYVKAGKLRAVGSGARLFRISEASLEAFLAGRAA